MNLFERLGSCHVNVKSVLFKSFLFLSLAVFSANSFAGGQCVAPGGTGGSVPSDLIGEKIVVELKSNAEAVAPFGGIELVANIGSFSDVFVDENVPEGLLEQFEVDINSDNVLAMPVVIPGNIFPMYAGDFIEISFTFPDLVNKTITGFSTLPGNTFNQNFYDSISLEAGNKIVVTTKFEGNNPITINSLLNLQLTVESDEAINSGDLEKYKNCLTKLIERVDKKIEKMNARIARKNQKITYLQALHDIILNDNNPRNDKKAPRLLKRIEAIEERIIVRNLQIADLENDKEALQALLQ